MVYPLIESLLFPLTLRMAHGLREAETSAPFDKLASLQQLDQLKNEFFSIASHELQSPLTVIKGFTEQLLWDLRRQQTTTFEDSLLAIQRQVERLQKLTRDLLDISSCATNQLVLEKREVALSTLVTCVLDELALAHRRTVCREIAPHITLQCDPSRIEQVIRNLVENAFKYSPTTSPVTVRLQQSHDAVKLAVRDEGAGIDAVDLPLVFLPYYRASNTRHAKPGGSGLGLALCKYLVTGHNGAIHVESTPGKGATFTVTLPVG